MDLREKFDSFYVNVQQYASGNKILRGAGWRFHLDIDFGAILAPFLRLYRLTHVGH